MADINFFKHYEHLKKDSSDKYMYVTAGLVGALIIGSASINIAKIHLYNKEIEIYNAKLNTEDVQSKIKTAEEVNAKLDILSKYETQIDDVTSSINTREVVSIDVIDKISSTVPSDVSFESMNISEGTINIEAISNTRSSIGELENRLKKLDILQVVHVGTISENTSLEGMFAFNIKCTLKGGN